MIRLPDAQKNCEDIFLRFDRIHERDRHMDGRTDRQTDRQTPHNGIGRTCIASRGKNQQRESQQSYPLPEFAHFGL